MAATKTPSPFETTECTRCGGGGQYSYCASKGTTCFKCDGTGFQLTKRGEKARKMYDEAISPPATEIKVGDTVKLGMYSRFETVTESFDGGEGWWVIKAGIGTSNLLPTTRVRKGWTAEQKTAFLNAALAYQESLRR